MRRFFSKKNYWISLRCTVLRGITDLWKEVETIDQYSRMFLRSKSRNVRGTAFRLMILLKGKLKKKSLGHRPRE